MSANQEPSKDRGMKPNIEGRNDEGPDGMRELFAMLHRLANRYGSSFSGERFECRDALTKIEEEVVRLRETDSGLVEAGKNVSREWHTYRRDKADGHKTPMFQEMFQDSIEKLDTALAAHQPNEAIPYRAIPYPGEAGRFMCRFCSVNLYPPEFICPTEKCRGVGAHQPKEATTATETPHTIAKRLCLSINGNLTKQKFSKDNHHDKLYMAICEWMAKESAAPHNSGV